ncbi:chromosome alignment-maintaining phosphoprotein 1-like [Pungitius pungitius]|uniref:chromosome alignment-maintaining phosphoprotein 1-like n=1 Tax=Pungitius pungitius TaxID=134920 RepID=UPI002E166CF8
MPNLDPTPGEVGGAPAAHLQCPLCGHFSKSHVHQLTHVAAAHPARLEGVAVGRLGNIVMYQSSARLFHCADCFFTCRDFPKLYKHLISRHCEDRGGGGQPGEADAAGRERSSEKEVSPTQKERDEEVPPTQKEHDEEVPPTQKERDEEVPPTQKEHDEEVPPTQKERDEEVPPTQKERDEEVPPTQKERDEEVPLTQKEHDEEVPPTQKERDGEVLMFDGLGFHCLICGWMSKLKALGVNHAVRKHNIPKAYASQAIRPTEEVEGAVGLSGEQLKQEMEATAKVVRFISNRFVCLICGWKTKLKGFAINHVVRCHDVERPYACQRCARRFFLPSRLQQHVRAEHRPGRYACPFCCFRSHFLGGFRRHCSRCNAREENGGRLGPGGGRLGGEEEENEDEEEERKERKRRRTESGMEKEEEDDDN